MSLILYTIVLIYHFVYKSGEILLLFVVFLNYLGLTSLYFNQIVKMCLHFTYWSDYSN